ncbi:MAG: hypothetical protein FJ272_14635 [Planctomycetes bacterium]|nr:hypothetical protein [Planctomycetota bacterium]
MTPPPMLVRSMVRSSCLTATTATTMSPKKTRTAMRPASTWARRKRVMIDPTPELILLGKPDCSDCIEARRILDDLGVPYTFRVIDDLLHAHEGWRGEGSWDVLVAYSMNDNRLPIVKFNDVYFGFREALAKLRTDIACPSLIRSQIVDHIDGNGCAATVCRVPSKEVP